MTGMSMLRGTFSAWDVRRLQKEASTTPRSGWWREDVTIS
jgi:hypothetical protein